MQQNGDGFTNTVWLSYECSVTQPRRQAMQTVGIGLIGCGGMCRHTTSTLITQSDALQVRALYDPDTRSIRAAQAELPKRATVYDDYRDLVRADDIDWVMIASWNRFHPEQTIAAFEAGKDVFCQKPLATTVDDCLAMYRAWRASGRMFTIGFTLRYSPHYRAVHKLLADGAIGDIVSMEFNECIGFNHGGFIMGDWRRLTENAGTHLLEKCCHDIDLANWFVGARARRVSSFGGLDFFVPQNEKHMRRLGKNEKGKWAYQTWGGPVDLNPFTSDKDIIDNQVAIIEYENYVRATFHTNCNAAIPERRMYICGTEGAIRADVIAGTIELARIGFNEKIEQVQAGVSGGHGGGDAVLGEELAASMLRGAPPSAGFVAGLESAVTCFAIDDAMAGGGVAELAPYWARVDEIMRECDTAESAADPAAATA
ncbi:MAG: gfo/Idh/MocA family oxidoreductase [Chitinivibrionales bacterium]|nr:gfo/Idh/MocA family oxidoreductase [Chitinivibrionales bacterium]